MNARKQRGSSWFSWGTSKLVPQEESFSDDVIFMDTHAAQLPDSFKMRFLFARSKKEALALATSAAVRLRDALLEDIEAFEITVEFFGRSSGKLLKHGCSGWASDLPQKQQQAFSTNAPEDEKMKRAMTEFINVASMLQGQIFGPTFNFLVDAFKASEFNIETQFRYLQSLLECAKTVVHNEPFITGPKAFSRGRQGAQDSIRLSQASECYGRVRQGFRAFRLHLEEEMALSENAMRRSLVLCCTHCLHAFTIFYDVFDARRHIQLIPSGEKRDASMHPLLQLFDMAGE
ncbi:hypothetical protein TRSC58_01099 [Trypanosoma rangeli SC58]|uniref:Uncharacterized protein n=1 Tax=Trypanosoma rangeli SC58 TaxID=429131 RepID=A0A061J9Z7_TRYRA|nr:hypothetical protein TRSC58_01099 [Trypanosoma rangeli SC58]